MTGLPSSLTCTLFQNWLCVKCVMALNSAYCSKAHRKNFVDTFCLVSTSFIPKCPFLDAACIMEAVSCLFLKGEEKLQSVRLLRPKITPAQLEIVERHCHQLTQVHLDGGFDRWTLLTVNPHIVRLKMTLHHTEKSYKNIPYRLLPIPVGTASPNMRLLSINGWCKNVRTGGAFRLAQIN